MVLLVDDLDSTLENLARRGLLPARRSPEWAILADPDGREIILQR